MSIQCRYCETEKDESQMVVRGGKPSFQCLDCKQKRTGLASAGGAPSRKKKSAAAARAKQKPSTPEISVPGGGYGFEAKITDENALQITQDNPGGEADNVVMTKVERIPLKAGLDRFARWREKYCPSITKVTVAVRESTARRILKIKKRHPLVYRGLELRCIGSPLWRKENQGTGERA